MRDAAEAVGQVRRRRHRPLDRGPEAFEADHREGVEEGLAVDEVAPRRTVADPGAAGEVPERQPLDARVAQDGDGLVQEHRAEVPVVERPLGHGAIVPKPGID